jgi:hypothetical protein
MPQYGFVIKLGMTVHILAGSPKPDHRLKSIYAGATCRFGSQTILAVSE